ncbi:MAG: flagellar protein FliT [Halioglobus sp.]
MKTQAQLCERLAHVLGMTEEMLKHANNGDWGRVATMEQSRREDLIACFSASSPSGQPELVAQAMATLIHLNDELMTKLRVARSEVMEQGQTFARNRSAEQSYQSVESTL